MIHAMSYPQPRRWVTRLDTFIQRKPGKIGTKPKACDIMNFKYTLETFLYMYSPTVGLLGSFSLKSYMFKRTDGPNAFNAWKHLNLEFK